MQPRPQRRTVAAEHFLLNFASNTDDPLGTGPVFVVKEVREGEEEQDKGIGAWGDICPTPPLKESSGRIVSPCVLFWLLHGTGRGATRHTDGIPVLR